MIPHQKWQDEINRQWSRRLEFMKMVERTAPTPPWYRRRWNMLRYRVSMVRERLGELIAGRRFDDY